MIEFIIAGLFVGFLTGLTGMGGGLLMTPLLILGFGLPAVTAVGTDLMYAGLTKLAGFYQHSRQGTVDGATLKWLAVTSLPGALLGVILIQFMTLVWSSRLDLIMRMVLGVTFLGVGCFMMYRIVCQIKDRAQLQMQRLPDCNRTPAVFPGKRKLMIVGGFGGLLVGMTSVGSGTVFIALLSCIGRFSPAVLVGTDIAHAALLTLVAGSMHAFMGNVDFSIAGYLLIGSIPGILAGSRLTLSIPEIWIRWLITLLLLGSSFKLL